VQTAKNATLGITALSFGTAAWGGVAFFIARRSANILFMRRSLLVAGGACGSLVVFGIAYFVLNVVAR
jgi:hypothetical protein